MQFNPVTTNFCFWMTHRGSFVGFFPQNLEVWLHWVNETYFQESMYMITTVNLQIRELFILLYVYFTAKIMLIIDKTSRGFMASCICMLILEKLVFQIGELDLNQLNEWKLGLRFYCQSSIKRLDYLWFFSREL